MLAIVLSWQYVDIYIGGLVAVIAYLVLASVVGGALDRRARRARTAHARPGEDVAAEPLRISRRTLLVGVGVIGAEAVGVGWLISELPSLIPLRTLPTGKGYATTVIAWAPDSRRLATNVGGGVIQVWDAATGAALQRLETHANDITGVAWAPDGQRIAVGQMRNICTPLPGGTGCSEADTIVVWDVTTERPLLTHPGDFQGLRLITWRPQYDDLLFVDDKGIHIWNARSGKDERVIPVSANANVNALAWSPDGSYLAGEVNDQFIVWDAATTKTIATYANDGRMDNFVFSSLAWSPDGKRLAAGDNDNRLRTWDALTGGNVRTYASPIAPGTTYPNLITVNAVAWSPDSASVAAASDDTTVRIWRDTTAGQRQPAFVWGGHLSSVSAVAWAPDGKQIASGNWEGVVQVWRPQGDLWG